MTKQTGQPDISIIIPCYNIEPYIDDCMQSVLCQKNIKKCEVICINDGSVDATPKKLAHYAEKYPKIVKVIGGSHNYGVSAARNAGIAKAQGTNIMFVDGDDMIGGKLGSETDSYYLEHFQDVLNSNPAAGMAVGNLLLTDEGCNEPLHIKRFVNMLNRPAQVSMVNDAALDFLDTRISSCAAL